MEAWLKLVMLENLSSLFYLSCNDLIMKGYKSPKFSISKISLFILKMILELRENPVIITFFDNVSFWNTIFSEIGTYFCILVNPSPIFFLLHQTFKKQVWELKNLMTANQLWGSPNNFFYFLKIKKFSQLYNKYPLTFQF